MTFAEYCDSVENTEKEQEFFEYLKSDEMQEAGQAFAKLEKIPFVGKIFAALNALDEYPTLAEYRQSKHYQVIKDFEFEFDAAEGKFNMHPNDKQARKAGIIVLLIIAAIAAIILCRKFCRCRKAK